MSALAVRGWAAWAPGLESAEAWRAWARAPQPMAGAGAPPARAVPPLLRRRCDDLARMFLHVADAACGDAALRAGAACVFATRKGSFATQVELLETLAAGAPVSPTRFSHSVHNTALGLFSIWSGNREAGSSIAAGRETFAHGLLETALLAAREPARPVLLVCGDEAEPEPFAGAPEATRASHALALLLAAGEEGPGLRLALEAPEGAPAPDELPQALAFLRWWLSEEPELRLDAASGCWVVWRRAGRPGQ